MTLERLVKRAARELRYQVRAVAFSLPCWLGCHTMRRGRCEWCRREVSV